jgi:hypothetical protein
MPFVPSRSEARRLRRAIDRAAFSEAERIWWLIAFLGVLTLGGILLWRPGPIGIVGFIGGLALLYWRLRGGHLSRSSGEDRDLHGVGLSTREQRAFTALMLRHALSGSNPLGGRSDHDPIAIWAARNAQLASGTAAAPTEEPAAAE